MAAHHSLEMEIKSVQSEIHVVEEELEKHKKNLEFDIIGKYIARILKAQLGK